MQSSSSDGAPAEGRRRPPHIHRDSRGESGTCMAPHPSAIRVAFLFFFLRYFFSFSFSFFFLEVQTRCIVGAADCVAWASLK